MSPTIHLAGFRYYGLSHTYEIHQTKTVDELSALVSSQKFGGASVTMPHKLAIGKFCSSITEHARVMGAVNTLIPEDGTNGRLKGDNTDWTGLLEILQQKSNDLSTVPETGLVIGAGGASRAALYAMYQMGLNTIHLFNRTKSRAEDIARDFAPLFKITVLGDLNDLSNRPYIAPDVIIGTIPADRTTIDLFPTALFSKTHGICIDMSYKPRHTPLLAAAMRSGRGWATVTGIEVLLEQAFDQFKLWTGKEAPKAEMREALAARDRQLAASGTDDDLE
jgi:shikimate-5-dehydrogenase